MNHSYLYFFVSKKTANKWWLALQRTRTQNMRLAINFLLLQSSISIKMNFKAIVRWCCCQCTMLNEIISWMLMLLCLRLVLNWTQIDKHANQKNNNNNSHSENHVSSLIYSTMPYETSQQSWKLADCVHVCIYLVNRYWAHEERNLYKSIWNVKRIVTMSFFLPPSLSIWRLWLIVFVLLLIMIIQWFLNSNTLIKPQY